MLPRMFFVLGVHVGRSDNRNGNHGRNLERALVGLDEHIPLVSRVAHLGNPHRKNRVPGRGVDENVTGDEGGNLLVLLVVVHVSILTAERVDIKCFGEVLTL